MRHTWRWYIAITKAHEQGGERKRVTTIQTDSTCPFDLFSCCARQYDSIRFDSIQFKTDYIYTKKENKFECCCFTWLLIRLITQLCLIIVSFHFIWFVLFCVIQSAAEWSDGSFLTNHNKNHQQQLYQTNDQSPWSLEMQWQTKSRNGASEHWRMRETQDETGYTSHHLSIHLSSLSDKRQIYVLMLSFKCSIIYNVCARMQRVFVCV